MNLQRDIVFKLNDNLESDEVLLVVGPRQVGKTTALHQVEKNLHQKGELVHFLNLEDPDYLKLLNESPKNIFQIFPINLKRKSYLFIDEIQYLDDPSNLLKYLFDEYKSKLKILASGSSAFYLNQKFKDSLAGRKKLFNIFSLSFKEFIRFKSEPELAEKEPTKLTLSEKEKIKILYLEYITYGGYPRVLLTETLEEKIEILRELVYSYVKKDIFEANIRHEEEFYKLFKILAGQVGGMVNTMELSRTLGISKTAVENYIFVMQKSLHITLVRPFFRNVRKELTKMPKAYFTDLGLRNFLKNDFKTYINRDDKGQLLENAVYRQLLDRFGQEQIKFWRTTDQNEIDFIIEDKQMAYEVKANVLVFKKAQIRRFLDFYPDFKFKVISLNTPINSKISTKESWQI